MLPDYLRRLAKETAKARGAVNVAIFGPGKESPFFEKRQQAFEVIRAEYPEIRLGFYMIDNFVRPAHSYDDYVEFVHPAEVEQIEWADIILFIFTHHQLSAFAEFLMVYGETAERFQKCGLAWKDGMEVSRLWHFEAQRLLNGNADRLLPFSENDLRVCNVARDISLELFERIVIERWAEID